MTVEFCNQAVHSAWLGLLKRFDPPWEGCDARLELAPPDDRKGSPGDGDLWRLAGSRFIDTGRRYGR